MAYWLMKSEPSEFSIDDLQTVNVEPWSGVRNYQARNMMRDDMKKGDQAFFYHSNCKEPGIVGIMSIHKTAYPDDTSWDTTSNYYDPKSSESNPRWFMVDVQFKRKLNRTIALQELKNHKKLAIHFFQTFWYSLIASPVSFNLIWGFSYL